MPKPVRPRQEELERSVERPTMREWLERVQEAKPIPSKLSAAQLIRELRDANAVAANS